MTQKEVFICVLNVCLQLFQMEDIKMLICSTRIGADHLIIVFSYFCSYPNSYAERHVICARKRQPVCTIRMGRSG